MSLVGELFAKEFGEKIGKDWRRIMQVLASYNQKNKTFDCRLEISGLVKEKDKIIRAFYNFCFDLERKTRIKFVNRKKYPPFGLVGKGKEIEKRIERERRKKFKILPYVLKKVDEFLDSLPDFFYELNPLIFLRGSASPRTKKIFWYYVDKGKIYFLSDIDLQVVLPYGLEKIAQWLKLKARKFSVSNEIPINPFVTHYSAENYISELFYPLRISLEI